MIFKLSKQIQVGQKIKTKVGWRKVTKVTLEGAIVKEGLIQFGQVIYAWKI